MKNDDKRLNDCMQIYSIVNSTMDSIDDLSVFGAVITAVIQTWVSAHGLSPKEVVSVMYEILATCEEEEE